MITLVCFPLFLMAIRLIDLLSLSSLYKLLLLLSAGGCFALDLSRKIQVKPADRVLLLLSCATQLIVLINFFQIKTSIIYIGIAATSTLGILIQGIMPLFIVLMSARGHRFLARDDIPWTLVAGSLVVIVALPLAFTPLAAINTEQLYGEVAVSYSATKDFRISLPGFSGVVSGGVFAGIVAAGAVAYTWYEKQKWRRLLALAVACGCAILIWATEVRSALILLTVVFLVGVTGVWRVLAAYPKTGATICVLTPLAFVIAYPSFVHVVVANTPVVIEEALGRGAEENVMMLNGRVMMWETYQHNQFPWYRLLIGYGPNGEYLTGMAEYSTKYAGLEFENLAGVTAHNIFLNILYSNGVIGVLLFGGLLWRVLERSLKNLNEKFTPSNICHSVMVLSLCVEGTLESLFSLGFQFFFPLTLLLAAEIFAKPVVSLAVESLSRDPLQGLVQRPRVGIS